MSSVEPVHEAKIQITPNPAPKKIFFLEGNIGVGKTTILKRMRHIGFETIEEPLQRWEPYLSLLYSDPKLHGFSFQIEVLIWFMEVQKRATKANAEVLIVERSHFTSAHVFGQNLFDEKALTKWQFDNIKKLAAIVEDRWKELQLLHPIRLQTIYLQCKPAICMKRLRKRNRQCESSISLDLITKLHSLHDKVFANHQSIIIDGSKDAESVFQACLTHLTLSN